MTVGVNGHIHVPVGYLKDILFWPCTTFFEVNQNAYTGSRGEATSAHTSTCNVPLGEKRTNRFILSPAEQYQHNKFDNFSKLVLFAAWLIRASQMYA